MEEALTFALEECSIECNKTSKLQKVNLIKQLGKLLTTLSQKKHGEMKNEKRVEYYLHRMNERNIEYNLYLKREWGIK